MSRPVLCLDLTTFSSGQDRDRFLRWACRHAHPAAQTPDDGETAASAMQSSRGAIQLVGAWREEPGSRAFTLYTCRDGWRGGWRRMLELYIGVPGSLFLSAIDDVRYSALTLALVGTADNPPLTALADGSITGSHGVLELMTVPPGTELEQLRQVQTAAGTPSTHRLAGAFELGYQDCTIAALWIADTAIDPALWRRHRAYADELEVEVIGLSAYPGPALSGANSTLTTAGESPVGWAQPEHGH